MFYTAVPNHVIADTPTQGPALTHVKGSVEIAVETKRMRNYCAFAHVKRLCVLNNEPRYARVTCETYLVHLRKAKGQGSAHVSGCELSLVGGKFVKRFYLGRSSEGNVTVSVTYTLKCPKHTATCHA